MSEGDRLVEHIRSLEPNIFSSDERKVLMRMLRDDVQARCKAVNQRDIEAWASVKSKEDWEKFCSPRIEVLRKSLGIFLPAPKNLNMHVTRAR